MARTKDENFIVCLYENGLRLGDQETEFNQYEIGAQVGINPKAVDAICKLLIRSNFIKRGEEDHMIYITPHGAGLAVRLIDEL